MDEKIIIKNRDTLTGDTPEHKVLIEAMHHAVQTSNKLIADVELSLLGERYLTTE